MKSGYSFLLDSLNGGTYRIYYNDLYGGLVSKEVELLPGNDQHLTIKIDSLDASEFLRKTPLANLENGKSYKISWKGGDVTSFYGGYEMKLTNGGYIMQPVNLEPILLSAEDTNKVKQFEAELLSIEGKGICGGLNALTYTITKSGGIQQITDFTCNWVGWDYTIAPICQNVVNQFPLMIKCK